MIARICKACLKCTAPLCNSVHDDVRVIGPLCGEFTGHRWIPRTKASDAELWCFLWSAPWINGWVNNREAGDLRRHRTHFGVIVMMYNRFPGSHRYRGAGELLWRHLGGLSYFIWIDTLTLLIICFVSQMHLPSSIGWIRKKTWFIVLE